MKKKILFHSNHSKAFTGFGKNAKNILCYLHKTRKYEIVEAANGIISGHHALDSMPWKTIGTIPANPQVRAELERDAKKSRNMGYGGALIDDIVKAERPDIYIGAEDVWAFEGYSDRKWWNNISCMIWTTLDSLPILSGALKLAPKTDFFCTWASFAQEAMEKAGHANVRTLRGCLDTDKFFKMAPAESEALRKRNGLSNNFIIGFVFRNQLRKSVPNLLDGFKIFSDKNPEAQAKLLLHTNWSEGWDIPSLAQEKDISPNDIVTTHLCKKCFQYQIKPFRGQEQDCPLCGALKSQSTVNVQHGVREDQLNEIYNLMDVYCHPFTSGGQEIPIQEAKLSELITLVTNYSCGTDSCSRESGGVPLEWSEYREAGTQFIKANTDKHSIFKELDRVFKMPKKEKEVQGKKSRNFVLENYSIEVIGKQLESIIDSCPPVKWDFDFSEQLRDSNYLPPLIESDIEWLKDIYLNILNMKVVDDDEGIKHWLSEMNSSMSRNAVLDHFRNVALNFNQEHDGSLEINLKDLLDDKKDKRLALVVPGTIGDVFMCTSLLPCMALLYPEYAIYFVTKPEYFPILNNNPHVYKTLPHSNKFDDLLFLEGRGEHEGFFDIAFLPTVGTQKIFNYQHNAEDRIQFNLCTS